MITIIKAVTIFLVIFLLNDQISKIKADEFYSNARKLELREEVRAMFYHAYEGYLQHASGYDELRPLTCDGVDTWGSYSLTLVDALDTLAVMGNFTEFRRVVKKLESSLQFDKDINVSVFETNIRIVGGLLSAHLLSKRAGIKLEDGWPCTGPLLRLAEDVAKRLLPAFNTSTGMPYGTVNLRNGVPIGETSITCTAGVGTLIVEFGTLSRLTGDSIYEKLALNALHALWKCRSNIGLFGNHIDVQSGRWTAIDAGIGAGVDSFFEYLIKGSILLQRPELLKMFYVAREAINKYIKFDDWYMWVNMHKGQISLPVFQSLDAFWPGSLSMVNDIGPAIKTFAKYNSIWQKYGFLPESYNIPAGEISPNREGYPLRPELVESAMYLYRVTRNHVFLETGENILKSIQHSAKTKCGYATIRDIFTHERANSMESFFLSETTKYLYLLFDEENFLHDNAQGGDIITTMHGECVVGSGPYIFNTEAHPVDMSALHCCHDLRTDIFEDMDLNRQQTILKSPRDYMKVKYPTTNYQFEKANDDNDDDDDDDEYEELFVDIEIFDENHRPADKLVMHNFETIKKQRNAKHFTDAKKMMSDFINIVLRNRKLFNPSPSQILTYLTNFLKNNTLDMSLSDGLQVLERDPNPVLFSIIKKKFKQSMNSMWECFVLWSVFKANENLWKNLGFEHLSDDTAGDEHWQEISMILKTNQRVVKNTRILDEIEKSYEIYAKSLVNTTAMQEFLHQILLHQNVHNIYIQIPLLTNDEILQLYENHREEEDRHESFDVFNLILEVLTFTLQVNETMSKLNALLVNNNTSSYAKNTTVESSKLPQKKDNHWNSNKTILDITAKKELLSSTQKSNSATQAKESWTHQHTANSTNYSKWLILINNLIRKTTTNAPKADFNISELKLQTEKLLRKHEKQPVQYELFTCSRPEFNKLFAYGFFYPD